MNFLSVIIPAHNEERCLGATLDALSAALTDSGIAPHEVIVVDDASTDRTAEIAREHGVRVEASGKRNIAATRNAGARVSKGDLLLFVDADTLVTKDALTAMVRAVERGAVGGGARLSWDRKVRIGGELAMHAWNMISAATALPAGGFFFARRDAFQQVGGFKESVYVSEELWLGLALGKIGPLKIIGPKVVTSARKLESHSTGEFLGLIAALIRSPRKTLKSRQALDLWYVRRD